MVILDLAHISMRLHKKINAALVNLYIRDWTSFKSYVFLGLSNPKIVRNFLIFVGKKYKCVRDEAHFKQRVTD